MLFSDIVALAKQGYKPSDIKELMALTETTSEVKASDPAEPETPGATESAQPEPAAEAQSAGEEADARDEEIKNLKAEMARLQAVISAQSRPEPEKAPDDDKVLKDLALKFF